MCLHVGKIRILIHFFFFPYPNSVDKPKQNYGLFFIFRFSFFVFQHSNWGGISTFNIQNLISTFALRPNIVFWHSKTYVDIRIETEYYVFVFRFFCFSLFVFRFSSFAFGHSNWGGISKFNIQNPIFDIRTEAEYRILTFEIPIFTLEFRPNIVFWHWRISYFDIRSPILTFELRPTIVFWHSKSYFDSRI